MSVYCLCKHFKFNPVSFVLTLKCPFIHPSIQLLCSYGPNYTLLFSKVNFLS